MNLWPALLQSGALRALDDALANTLRRLDSNTPDEVLVAAALASLAVSRGHAGLDCIRRHTDDWRIVHVSGRMDHSAVDLDGPFIEIQSRQMRCNDLHAAIFDCHWLFDKIHQ